MMMSFIDQSETNNFRELKIPMISNPPPPPPPSPPPPSPPPTHSRPYHRHRKTTIHCNHIHHRHTFSPIHHHTIDAAPMLPSPIAPNQSNQPNRRTDNQRTNEPINQPNSTQPIPPIPTQPIQPIQPTNPNQSHPIPSNPTNHRWAHLARGGERCGIRLFCLPPKHLPPAVTKELPKKQNKKPAFMFKLFLWDFRGNIYYIL